MGIATEMHIANRHPDCNCVACALAGLAPQPEWVKPSVDVEMWLEPDGYGDMTLWRKGEDDLMRPEALVRQFEVHPVVWSMLVKEVAND
jgi:hypothetical protein